jgi:hypothetical protein
MNIDQRWLLTNLTEDELLMFYNIVSLNSQYKNFDLDAMVAVKPQIFSQKFMQIQPLVNEQGTAVLETLKNKILEFENFKLQ